MASLREEYATAKEKVRTKTAAFILY